MHAVPNQARSRYVGKSLGILTSGGDSQGMNAAVRACVRMALYLGCEPYFIREGFQGLVEGGANIVRARWVSVSSIIHKGGTIIGTARCAEFRERSGRLKAVYNLVSKGIANLAVIGGDGSLTGANLLRKEWPELLRELAINGNINEMQWNSCKQLQIVGMVGTIDNDFCGTEMTIGADTAMRRINEVLSSIISTAYSHQRVFIIETMGAHSGYLALMTAISCEADYVFIPESPPADNWPEIMCKKIKQERGIGQRLNLIILAEGAVDLEGNKITSDIVKKVISDRLNMDSRVNVLGHLQRGGVPTAYDRIMASRVGAEAALALIESTQNSEPVIIGVSSNRIIRSPMMESVERTLSLKQAHADRKFEQVLNMRGIQFNRDWLVCQRMIRLHDTKITQLNGHDNYRIGVLHIGVPACGMNAAVRAFVINSLHEGYTPLGIHEGLDGLLKGYVHEMQWCDVNRWTTEGGALLCTKDTLAQGNFDRIAERLREFNIHGLLFIGGFDAYLSCLQMFKARADYPDFRIPMCVVPATIDNNMPGTDVSIGSDTSLNEITEICDRIRQSAQGTPQRVFIIETMGAYCGYLATMAGLASGADNAYIYEEKLTAKMILNDIRHMESKMAEDVKRGLILCNENASENYSTDFIYRLYKEEGKEYFSCRMNVLGHLQQGGVPSAYDRCLGINMGTQSVDWFKTLRNAGSASNNDSACLVGLVDGQFKFTPVITLESQCNIEKRLPHKEWWLEIRPIMKILAKHQSAYQDEDLELKHSHDHSVPNQEAPKKASGDESFTAVFDLVVSIQ